MSTDCITEAYSYICYKCETQNQQSNLHSFKILNGQKMAPLVEQEKNTVNDVLVAEHSGEQYTSTETDSSENNSDAQPDSEDSVNKLRNYPLNDSPPDVIGTLNHDPSGPYPSHFLNAYSTSNHLERSFFNEKLFSAQNGVQNSPNSSVSDKKNLEFDGLYHCPKCDFVGRNDDELHEHAHTHDPYECAICGFLVDIPDNLEQHIKAEHLEIRAAKWKDYVIFHEPDHGFESPPQKKSKAKKFAENLNKPRKTTCKLCNNFVGNTKMEYYAHLKAEHYEDGKLLQCKICPFIALYKHHLEYHFNNHLGTKPYKCDKCDYCCVNRSMLNSHYKSHSDIYQYSCNNCSYMTKYLHSLKMHLRKYNHQPGRVLNPDGSVNTNSIIDVHGKRRGPKNKKRKIEADQTQEGRGTPKSKSSPSPPSSSFIPHPSQNIRILYNPHIYNNYTGNLYVRSGPSEATNYLLQSPPAVESPAYRCPYCEFVTVAFDVFNYHLYSHAAQDRLSDGSFNPRYPEFLQHYNFGSVGVGSSLNSESFSKNIVNQSTPVQKKNIDESQRMGIANNGNIHFQNSKNNMNNYEAMQKSRGNMNESFGGMVLSPELMAFNGQPYPKPKYRRRKENKNEKWLNTNTPLPNATLSVKEEVIEPMNGIQSPFVQNPTDNGPLDLTIKPLMTPETKNSEISSPYRLLGGSMKAAMKNNSSGTSRFGEEALPNAEFGEEESKLIVQKTNRRKGKAFKLNQYLIENDPVSDGAETEPEKIRVSDDGTSLNEDFRKPAFRSEIKKSVPRINFKPTLNSTKWNEHNYLQPGQAEFSKNMPVQQLKASSMEHNNADQQTDRQRVGHTSNASWCLHCEMDTGSPELQEFHSSYHSKNDPFTCAKCGLRCEDKIGFNWHIISGSRINGNCINTIEERKS